MTTGLQRAEEQSLLSACLQMTGHEHKQVGRAMHDQIIGALGICSGKARCCGSRTVTWTGTGTKSSFPELDPQFYWGF